jgi:hypothetical protein
MYSGGVGAVGRGCKERLTCPKRILNIKTIMNTIYLNVDWTCREVDVVSKEFALNEIAEYEKNELYASREVNLGTEHFIEDDECDTSIIEVTKPFNVS